MASVPSGVDPTALTVAARRVLLDALTALSGHLDALVLVGAQAVYLRSGSADLAVATATSDGDVGIDPELLRPAPRLEAALTGAGFTRDVVDRQSQPGTWYRLAQVDGRLVPVAVDLLAPQTLAAGGRGADLPPHTRGAVRRVLGIELAVEDHDSMPITSLEQVHDDRSLSVQVAGVAALLVAKAFKIHDRVAGGRPARLSDKDAADVYRLMITADPYEVADTFEHLVTSRRVGETARTGLRMLHEQFGVPRGVGVDMAVRALAASITDERIRQVAPAFLAALPYPRNP